MTTPLPPLTPVLGSLYALEVPSPFPMKTVTVLVDRPAPGQGGAVTLVDTAIDTPQARAGLEGALGQLGLRPGDVERVILTHHHPDHSGLAGWFEEGGAQVFMLDREIQHGGRYWAEWDNWLPRVLTHMREHGLPPELHAGQERFHRHVREMVRVARHLHPLHEGQTLTLAGCEWEVLWLPGHADGHLALWQPEEKLLIAGDTVLPRITPNIGLYAYSRPNPLGDYLTTLDRLEALAPRRALVGHYGPELLGVRERAAELSAHHHARLAALEAAVRQGPGTAYALTRQLFPHALSEPHLRFALAETLAHLEYLRIRSRLDLSYEHQVLVYSC